MRDLTDGVGPSDVVGACPSCGATLSMTMVADPDRNNRPTKSLLHPMPFCHYFGVTDPARILDDLKTGRPVRMPE